MHKRLSCTISSNGRTAIIHHKDPRPVLADYKKRYKGRGATYNGKTYAERCFEYDMDGWLAVHEIKGKEYPIEKNESPLPIEKDTLFICMLNAAGDQVKIINE